MSVNWLGDSVARAIKERLGANMLPAATVLADKARANIATPGPPRSTPGKPPRMDSGDLFRSVKPGSDPSTLRGWVQSDVAHSVYTEEGTPKMAARPWFLPSLREGADEAARELAR